MTVRFPRGLKWTITVHGITEKEAKVAFNTRRDYIKAERKAGRILCLDDEYLAARNLVVANPDDKALVWDCLDLIDVALRRQRSSGGTYVIDNLEQLFADVVDIWESHASWPREGYVQPIRK